MVMSGVGSASTTGEIVTPKSPVLEVTQEIKSESSLKTESKKEQASVTEAFVREYFKNNPLLIEIAKCESTFRQYDTQGNPIRGKANSADVGVMQINEYYHREDAVKLGFDIDTLEGNLGYAKYLFEKKGGDPWSASYNCWSHAGHLAKN